MKRVIQFCLKNKFAVWLLTLIVVVAGIYSGFTMKLETMPDINAPVLMVSTTYAGATPEEVAEQITKPIEQKVKSLPGVDVVSSSSMQNASSIQIEYGFDKNMDKAKDEVKEALENMDLPDRSERPKVSRINLNDFPILSLSVSNDKESLKQLTKTVEDDIVPELEGIDGVSSVQTSGQYESEIQLTYKKDKLKKYGLDASTVEQFIKGTNVAVPLGLMNIDQKEKAVVVDGSVKTLKDLKNIKIPYTPVPTGAIAQSPNMKQGTGMGQAPGNEKQAAQSQAKQSSVSLPTVKLSEIASLTLVNKHESISRTNGKESIGIQITKSPEANTVEVADQVNKTLNDLKKDHKGLTVVNTFDQATPIKDSVHTMLSKAVIGGIFAVLIILLFLRNIRSTIISIVSIPVSLVIALLVLKQMDISLNIMTLGAMTVAIGRVVDDSIVVIENIYRRMTLSTEKLRGKELIREATREMFIPIMSSTIVTIAVFLPLALVEGPVGEIFLPFALTIVFALVASLLVAITIVPSFAHSLFKNGLKKNGEHKEGHGKLAAAYKKILNWSLNHKLVTFGLACLILAGSLFLIPKIGVSFLPSDEQKMMIATYNPDPGQTDKEIEQMAVKAENYFKDDNRVKMIQYSVDSGNPMTGVGSKSGIFYVEYKKDTKDFEQVKKQVIDDLKKVTKKGEWKTQDFSTGASSNKLEVYAYGSSIDELKPVVTNIEKVMKKNGSLTNVDSSLSKSYEEYTLVANQNKLSKLGLTAGQVGSGLSNIGEEPVLTTIKRDGKELNVYVHVDKKNYKDINELTNTKVETATGTQVRLKNVMDVEKGSTPNTITHRDGRVYVSVSADIIGNNVGKVSQDVQKKLDDLQKPDDVSISMGGVTEQITDSFQKLGLAMLVAIAIVYLILVITFGGGLAPFAILFSLPFTVIGGLFALYIAKETLSISSMIGALMLIGIVVTNAIVLIDRVIHKEREGLSTRDALLEAGATRLRPILMTAIATIGALLPLAFGFESGGLISRGLGVAVIGGLTSSTLLTLVIVPIVYEFLMKFKRKKRVEH
ncbi:efflux RND transporter permease subunit [Fictibacillus gelatini]|uniref:efflux RND transporter permease subunit n=1 Tax=Fictibacillus gelatini TaxID=225985 RepID=UPI0004231DBE|nr:efflux RND transporter permease subunit [Fictibacillus gelatini]